MPQQQDKLALLLRLIAMISLTKLVTICPPFKSSPNNGEVPNSNRKTEMSQWYNSHSL